MPYFNDFTEGKFSIVRNTAKFALLIVALMSGSCIGTIPVFVTDVDIGDFSLPWYSPPNEMAGTNTMPVNMEGLYINQSYMTSDGITHIALKGTIDSGIPHGLLWSAGTVLGYPGGTYGYNMAAAVGSYGGYGDFAVGSLTAAGVGGSFAIGSLDFSAEWVMAAPYSAFVIRGLVGDNAGVTITETNESLYLYSLKYRSERPTNEIIGTNYSSGRLEKITNYSANNRDYPNSFKKVDITKPGKDRGGYMVLISKKANPATAMIEVDYKDGTKKKYNIDYSGVNFNEVGLTEIPKFQESTPPAGSYSIIATPPAVNGEPVSHTVTPTNGTSIFAGSISMKNDGFVPVPLFLRPLYKPVKEAALDTSNPRNNTTNMIHRIWFDATSSTYYNKDNFRLTWDDITQSITLYRREQPLPDPLYDGETVDITIHAELRQPYYDTVSGVNIREFTFYFTIFGDEQPPPP
ncbi:MAG: hypothetical protein LBD44_00700 [Spirochaetaceae bacterium]|jgi:hypothetical protein|nr:hypothetical protein [Spirochaetaceae bacterium]